MSHEDKLLARWMWWCAIICFIGWVFLFAVGVGGMAFFGLFAAIFCGGVALYLGKQD